MLKTVLISLRNIVVGLVAFLLIAAVIIGSIAGLGWIVINTGTQELLEKVAAGVGIFFVIPAVIIGAHELGESFFKR